MRELGLLHPIVLLHRVKSDSIVEVMNLDREDVMVVYRDALIGFKNNLCKLCTHWIS